MADKDIERQVDALAVSRPERNRWPHEPIETFEPPERDARGWFDDRDFVAELERDRRSERDGA
jgi:hypothetical protein